jgi:hypothetical protein
MSSGKGSGGKSLFFFARVNDILLSPQTKTKDFFINGGGWTGLGSIKFSPLGTVVDEDNPSSLIAKPLFNNISKYPILEEIVMILNAPSYGLNDNPQATTFYYLTIVGIWNSVHHNAFPDITLYKGDELNFGKTFTEKKDIRSLLPEEGDILLEGRWGNSIRFSSTTKQKIINNPWSTQGDVGSPITIIRNRQSNIDINPDPWVPVYEDPSNDGSSIYLCAGQDIPLEYASKNLQSFNVTLGAGFNSSLQIPDPRFISPDQSSIEADNLKQPEPLYYATESFAEFGDDEHNSTFDFDPQFLIPDFSSGCFIKGTKITMSDGVLKNIEDVLIGEYILGQEGAHNRVIEYSRPVIGERNLISFNGGTPFITNDHPIYIKGKGWMSFNPEMTYSKYKMKVKKYQIGDIVDTPDTTGYKLEQIQEHISDNREEILYNFKLNGNHTYVANNLIVHNKTTANFNKGAGSLSKCPPLPNDLKEEIVKSTISKNAYGGFISGKVSFVAKVDKAYTNLKAQGIDLSIGDSLRTFEFQAAAHEEYLKNVQLQKAGKSWAKNGIKYPATQVPDNIASPCEGYHVRGQALDIDQQGKYGGKTYREDIVNKGKIYRALYDAGLRRISNEWWHWSVGETDHAFDATFPPPKKPKK